MIKIAVFDMDGTIIDSLPDLEECMNILLKKYGYSLTTTDKVLQNIGYGAKEFVYRSLPENIDEKIKQEFFNEYISFYANCGSPKTKLFDGIKECLDDLKSRGIKLGILTNKPEAALNFIYDKLLKQFKFDYIIGDDGRFKVKPSTEGIDYIVKSENLKPEECVIIGDGETDACTAISYGAKQIGALWGYRTKEQLQKVGAEVFAESPYELVDILRRI